MNLKELKTLSIAELIQYSPLLFHLKKALNLERGPVENAKGLFSQTLEGFNFLNDPFNSGATSSILNYISWALLIFFLIKFSSIKAKKNSPTLLMFLSILTISFSIVLFYEPTQKERWDFFLITLFYLLFWIGQENRAIFKHPLLIASIAIQSTNTLISATQSQDFQKTRNDLIYKFKEDYESQNTKQIHLFDIKDILIEPYIMSHLAGKEDEIYFINPKDNTSYQNYFSHLKRNRYSIQDIWKFKHFEAYLKNLNTINMIPEGLELAPPPCHLYSKESVYVSEHLKEYFKRVCY
jgi:hypothetical protein